MSSDIKTAEVIARLDVIERELLNLVRAVRQARIDLFGTLDNDSETVVE